jgi:hypothetical protein
LFAGCSDKNTIETSFSPTQLQHCDRAYQETNYKTEWTSGSDASASLSLISGKITFSPSTKKTHKDEVTWRMDQNRFYDNCSEGNFGVWSSACPYYQQCVSLVKHLKSGKPSNEFTELDFEGVATFIKSEQSDGEETKSREKCYGDRCWQVTDNITKVCDGTSSTYSPTVIGNSIFHNIPEIGYQESQQLGKKVIAGFGTCLCVLHKRLKIKDDYSIGYCSGEKFLSCDGKGAFCGRKVKS